MSSRNYFLIKNNKKIISKTLTPFGDKYFIDSFLKNEKTICKVLKIPEGVDLFIREVPNYIVRGKRLFTEEFRQSIILVSKAGSQVKVAFSLEDAQSQCAHIIPGQANAEAGIEHIDNSSKRLGDIKGREGDENAESGAVNCSCGSLQVP